MNKTMLAGLVALSLAMAAGLARADVIDFASLPDGLTTNPLTQPGGTFTTLGGGFNVIGLGGLCPSVSPANDADCSHDLMVDFTAPSTPISLDFIGNNDVTIGDSVGAVAFYSGATLLGSVSMLVTDTQPFTKDVVSLTGFSGVTRLLITTTDFGGLIYDDFAFTPGKASGTPEPAAWALMIGGFGLAGAALRRRRSALAA